MRKWIVPLLFTMLAIPVVVFADVENNNLTDHLFGQNASRFYAGVGVSAEWLLFENKNNTLLTAPLDPANPDLFALSGASILDGAFSGFFGYQWVPQYGEYINLFLEYDRFLQVSPEGTRYSYGLTAGTSSYSYALSTQAIFLGFKYDFLSWKSLLPYGEVGLGVSQNQFKNFYNNLAYSYGFSPLITAFPDKNTYNPAAFVGFGLDMQISEDWLFSVGYRFEYLGNIDSGDVTSVPAPPEGSGLPISPVHLSNQLFSNAVTSKISYLFSS
jgi:opacity protein-like surface antigen